MKKFTRLNKDIHCMRKAGFSDQPWYKNNILENLNGGLAVELPDNAPSYITNLKEGDTIIGKEELDPKVGIQVEKIKADTSKEVKTGVKDEVASTPKVGSVKHDSKTEK